MRQTVIGRARDETGFEGSLPVERLGWGQVILVAEGSLDLGYRGAYWPLRSGQAFWHAGQGFDSAHTWGGARVLRLAVSEPPNVQPRLLRGSALLMETLIRLAVRGELYGSDELLVRVALAEVESSPSIPLTPPWPRSAWASKAAIVLRDVGPSEMSVDWLAGKLEMSRRSLERRFAHETGLTPGEWRREARLIESLRLLSIGMRRNLSGAVGFKSRSAFYARFQARFGMGPVRFWEELVGERLSVHGR